MRPLTREFLELVAKSGSGATDLFAVLVRDLGAEAAEKLAREEGQQLALSAVEQALKNGRVLSEVAPSIKEILSRTATAADAQAIEGFAPKLNAGGQTTVSGEEMDRLFAQAGAKPQEQVYQQSQARAGGGGKSPNPHKAALDAANLKLAQEKSELARVQKELAEQQLADAKIAAAKAAATPPPPTSLDPKLVSGQISDIKSELPQNKSGGIDIGKYVTAKHEKTLRDAAKREKENPGVLKDAKEAVAMQVGDKINQEAQEIAIRKGYSWDEISHSFGVRNSLFTWTSLKIDTATGQHLVQQTRDVDPELISRVYTEATRSDYVAGRTAFNIAFPPLAPLVGTSGRLFSERLNPANGSTWKNLGLSLAATGVLGFVGGQIREWSEAEQADAKGWSATRYDYDFQRGLDRGIPFVYSEERPSSFAEIAGEAIDPFVNKNMPFLGDSHPITMAWNAYSVYKGPDKPDTVPATAPLPAGGPDFSKPTSGPDFSRPPSAQTGAGAATSNKPRPLTDFVPELREAPAGAPKAPTVRATPTPPAGQNEKVYPDTIAGRMERSRDEAAAAKGNGPSK